MRGSRVALAVGAILTGAAAFGRLLDRGPLGFPDLQLGAGQTAEAWGPTLLAAGALCVAALARRRSPWLSLFSAGAAAVLASVAVVGEAREQLPNASPSDWPALVGVAAATAIAGSLMSALLAWRAVDELVDRGPRSLGRVLATVGPLVVLAWQSWALLAAFDHAANRAGGDPLVPVRVANRVFLIVLSVDVAVAALLVAGRRARRARDRSRGGAGAGKEAPRLVASGLVTALADEFVPGFSTRAGQAAAAERERLAADLHARVVPELRRAVDAASPGDTRAAGLREALEDVEDLMAARHSVVLERFGLVPALEWLAERTEARTGTTVTLDLPGPAVTGPVARRPVARGSAVAGHAAGGPMRRDGGPGAGDPAPGNLPRDVERAAFRIAMLAVDNALRHAPGEPVSIRVQTSGERLALEVTDTGPGFDPVAVGLARRAGHRGLADMEAEAMAAGGRLDVGRDEAATRTRVRFDWPAR